MFQTGCGEENPPLRVVAAQVGQCRCQRRPAGLFDWRALVVVCCDGDYWLMMVINGLVVYGIEMVVSNLVNNLVI